MNEWEVISDKFPIRQGDIIVSHPKDDGEILHAIILTADCDIAQSKTGMLTVAPLIGVAEYLTTTWARGKLEDLRIELKRDFSILVNTINKRRDPSAGMMSRAFIDDWHSSTSVEDICSILGAQPEELVEAKEISNSIIEIEFTRNKYLTLGDYVNKYHKIRVNIGYSQAIPKEKTKRGDIKTVLKNLKQDVFFLSSVPRDDSSGWLVQLREFYTVPIHAVTASAPEWADDATQLLRVARLKPEFKYAVSQQFGALFSRIGLPSDYEAWRDLLVDEICYVCFPGD